MSGRGFLARAELLELGLGAVGDDVHIDAGAVFYGAHRISIGSHVRIDAGTVLSAGEGGIVIGDHVHISVRVFLTGAATIELGSFAGVSAGTAIFSSNDDYRGGWLTGPTIPDDLRNVTSAPVVLGEHAIVGAGCVILPGVTIGQGAAVGALTCVRKDVAPFAIVAGPHGEVLGERDRKLLEFERELRRREG
ncbi:MAG TPA: acyltransferase [Solirubrobacteraceae bacterium]|jgi:acetyltransferase-like isoleucine patch superfamily enzyme|nr:acyltransferase [Solirubrobacteraceae bacterium]